LHNNKAPIREDSIKNAGLTSGFQNFLSIVLRVFLGLVFVWASWGKILDPAGFAIIIQNYRILPAWAVNPTALVLPWIEILSGLSLLTGWFMRGSLLIINFLLLVFAVAFIINIQKGIDINCGCFSLTPETAKGMYCYLLRDLLLLCAGLWVFFFEIKRRKFY